MSKEWRAGLAGVISAAAALAMATLADALWSAVPSLVAVVDQTLIRLAPGVVVRSGIEKAGTADKTLLAFGTVAISLALGALLGVAARRRRPVGDVAFGSVGLLAVLCATGLPTVSVAGTVTGALLAAGTGIVCLRVLLGADVRDTTGRVSGAAPIAGAGVKTGTATAPTARLPGTTSRRHFLVAGSVAALGAAAAFAVARGLSRGAQAAAQRAGIRIPAAAEPAPAVAAAVGGGALPLTVDGLSPLIVPTRDFYRIDEALMVPSVDPHTWRLRISGMVDAPFELTFDELLSMPLIERDITLSCVSNEVGGPLVGNARWLGVRLADLLKRARVQPTATQIVGRSVDHFTVGFPTDVALDGRDAMVAVAQNGEPLTAVHGFPARLVVPGLYGYVSATKWLSEIELTTWDAFDAYWVERGWAKRAPIKIESRIDVPRDYSDVGVTRPKTAAGVAWAPHRGIAKVEVRVDKGVWMDATLGPSLGNDAWRQWTLGWDAPPGNHTLEVRATTFDGEVQSGVQRDPFPDGAAGYHKVNVRLR